MKNLVNTVITQLDTLTYPVVMSVIRASYSKAVPVYPMIVVEEISNATLMALKGEERLSSVVYQIDIFSKDMFVATTLTSGVAVCREIATSVDAGLNSIFGMTRTSSAELPDINDATVSRLVLRYSGILDVKTDYMYR